MASYITKDNIWWFRKDSTLLTLVTKQAYLNSNKVIQDLTENELLTIREMHLNKINAFFKDKENYLEVELSDPEISSKICNFINISSDVEFPSEDSFRLS